MTEAVDIFSIALGLVALLVSVLAYVQSLPSAQLKRDQQAAMHTLATQALLSFDMLETVLGIERAGIEYDPYLLELMRTRARFLQEAVDAAIRLRLWNEVVSQKNHSMPLFAAFMGSLISAASEGATHEAWKKQHLTMGIVRVIVLCEEYHRSLKGEPLGPLLTAKVARWSANGMVAESWEYLVPRAAAQAAPTPPAAAV